MQGGDVWWSNHTNGVFLVSILVVCVFEEYGLLANDISYPKFSICKVYKTSEDALIWDIFSDYRWAVGGLLT